MEMMLFTGELPQIPYDQSPEERWQVEKEKLQAYLPAWAFNGDWSSQHIRGRHSMGGVWEAAMLQGFLGLASLWGSFVGFPILALATMSPCGEVFPGTWLFLLYPMFLSVQLWIEWTVFKNLVTYQVIHTAPFKLFGYPLRFTVWLAFVFCLSAFAHLDILSTGLVLAKAYRTSICEIHNTHSTSAIWNVLIDQSVFKNVPLAGNFLFVFAFGWLLMLMQPTFVILSTRRSTCSLGPSKSRSHLPSTRKHLILPYCGSLVQGYNTCLVRMQTHEGAATMLAEFNRMATVTMQDQSYLQIVPSVTGWRSHYILGHLSRTLGRFVLLGMSEVAYQINIQASLLAVNMAAELPHNQSNWVTVVSVIVTALSAAYNIWQTSSKIKNLHSLIIEKSEDSLHPRYTRNLSRSLSCIFVIFTSIYVMLVLYALMKLSMAFICKDHVWNFSIDTMSGCVDLE